MLNTSENPLFVKREKQFLVAVNCETDEFFYGGRVVIFLELKFQRGLFFCSHFFAGGANFNLKII